jgi:HSP20 family molecular chaperone IbpA
VLLRERRDHLSRLLLGRVMMTSSKTIDAMPGGVRKVSSSFPALRLTEAREHMTVVALVPGFGEDDLDIVLDKDVLRISGRCPSGAPRDFSAIHRGRRAIDFQSEIKLLADVAWIAPEVALERGVLTVRLHKDLPESRPSIPIRLA